ncbi:homoserine kinase [Porticoccus sp.]|uniref:homoserine kinase n=1 Tax=Porticoccus sp. TaxID=2024853 RepID=UPI003F69749C
MSSFLLPDIRTLNHFLAQYSPERLVAGIDAVYSARNHLTCRFSIVGTPGERFFLVVASEAARDRLAFSARLVNYLREQQIPVTPCLADHSGHHVTNYGESPALLFQLPEGHAPEQSNTSICKEIGTFLGRMHASTHGFCEQYSNPRSLIWLNLAAQELIEPLSAGDAALLQEQLSRFRRTVETDPDLPSGPLIGSLFGDQLIFRGELLQAVTGFFFSCTDWLLLDVAQAVNEWCCNQQGELDKQLTSALLNAYAAERPFTAVENQYWQDILCFSATRFWISRLLNSLLPEDGDTASVKREPAEYREKLRRRIVGYFPLPDPA